MGKLLIFVVTTITETYLNGRLQIGIQHLFNLLCSPKSLFDGVILTCTLGF